MVKMESGGRSIIVIWGLPQILAVRRLSGMLILYPSPKIDRVGEVHQARRCLYYFYCACVSNKPLLRKQYSSHINETHVQLTDLVLSSEKASFCLP